MYDVRLVPWERRVALLGFLRVVKALICIQAAAECKNYSLLEVELGNWDFLRSYVQWVRHKNVLKKFLSVLRAFRVKVHAFFARTFSFWNWIHIDLPNVF